MRVALFTETFLPKIDGVVNTLCRALEYAQRHGHECLVFAPEGGPERYAGHRIIGHKGYRYPFYRELKYVSPFTDVSDRLRAFKPDIIHLANPITLGLAGLTQGRKLGYPVVASYHTDLPGFMRRWGHHWLAEGMNWYQRWIHNQTALNLCPSTETKKMLEENGFERVKIWSRGVDTNHFTPAAYSASQRDRMSNSLPHKVLLLYVGRVSKEKRIDLLIPLLEELVDVRLCVVGDGPYRAELEERFRSYPVVFLGQLRGEALASAYASSDLLLFPSANETFGNVALEAMSSGIPVIAADRGGQLDVVVDGHNGRIFRWDSQTDFIHTVKQAVEDRNALSELGANARATAATRTWDDAIDVLFAEYDRVLGRYKHSKPSLNGHHPVLAV